LTVFSPHLADDLRVKILKTLDSFEPSYPFLDNLSTFGHVTSLIKPALIKE